VTAVTGPVEFLDLGVTHARLADELELAWKSVLASGRFVGGPEVDAFEAEFAEYCGTGGCIGVANGTDALELVLTALGIGPGDEVIVPGNTFVATAEAVCAVGARPRFVDVAPDTLLIDPAAAEAAVNSRTAALVAVHLYGQMADVPALTRLATRHGLALVEDAAQAHGARFDGRRAGSVGAAGTFSFYPGKNLGGLGDGGAVVSDDADLVARIRRLGNHGRSALERERHEVRGRNSRLDSLQAAVLRVKLAGLDEANRARADVVRRYRAHLPAWCVPVAVHPAAEAVHHLAVVQVPDRDAATAALDAARIGWGIHYPVPCHRQPAFSAFAEPLPVAEAAAGRILSLPLSPTLPAAAVDRVCAVLRHAGC
jgi:dTDP-4-amino-4,6-dideoxygalactose transaminase